MGKIFYSAFEKLQILIQEALGVLKPCGLLILEPPNSENLYIGTANFYLSPTHQRPVVPALLAFLPEYYGYERSIIIRLQESPALVANTEVGLMDVLAGSSPDYAVIAQKHGLKKHIEILTGEFENKYEGLDLPTLAQRYDQKIDRINERMNALSSMLNCVRSSELWRLTVPLRKLASVIKQK